MGGQIVLIGRQAELDTLRRLYNKSGFQMPVLFGRRRVGKTYLMSEFVRDKPAIFFAAVEDNMTVNLRNLSREIYSLDHPGADVQLAPLYPDLHTAFEAVFSRAESQRLVFVIDEYPYLAKADPSVSSILQALIDRSKGGSQLFLMLCGSSLSFMREQVLGEKSPLYGRRTAQLELKPLDFFEARQFFPNMDVRHAAQLYGAVGGIPLYLQQFSERSSFEDNIRDVFLDPSSILFEEPLNLLKQEVQKSATYNAIIGAIAAGKTENNEIATTVGIASSELTYYLKELDRIGLVEKERSVCDGSRRPVYRLSDTMFRFWYRFVMPNRSTIERRMPQRALSAVSRYLSVYMGEVFEQICREWLWRRNMGGELQAEFDELGRWWGNNPQLRREEEIDVVGVAEGSPVLVGECKWRNEVVGVDALETLDRRAALIHASTGVHRYLFSKAGFCDALHEMAAHDDRLHLVGIEDMLR